jgi:hypothetical protein
MLNSRTKAIPSYLYYFLPTLLLLRGVTLGVNYLTMQQHQIENFNRYFSEKAPELFKLIGPHLAFIPDDKGNYGVANMMGKQHYTEEQEKLFKKIVLDFENSL